MYNKLGIFLYIIILTVLMSCFSACSKKDDTTHNVSVTKTTDSNTTKKDTQETSKPTAKENSDIEKSHDQWKQAYESYIKSQNPEEWAGYNLIYIDQDDIPELVQVGGCEAQGTKIINYYKGQLHLTQLNRLYFSYIEKENLFCNSEGNMDVYYDIVYSIKDGIPTKIAEGHYGAEDNSNIQVNEEGMIIYKYNWNGEEVSENDYYEHLNSVYDTSKEKDIYNYNDDGCYSVEEILKKLHN